MTIYAMRDAVTFVFSYKGEKQTKPHNNSSLEMLFTKSRKERQSFLLY